MTPPLQGEIALVTGASRGIGAAIADTLAAQGATVIGTATSEAGAQAISERLKAHGGQGRVLDVSRAGQVEALIEAIGKEIAPLSILVNNAGITRDGLLMRMSDDDWQAILDTNLTSVYRASKAAMRGMMKARKGRIINIASVIGVTGNAGQTNYAAAKAGIIAFSKSLAKEIGPGGVTVNVVAPGFIETDMTAALPEDAKAALLGQIALGRLGQAGDIANAVAFLAGPGAGYITRQTLHGNRGKYKPWSILPRVARHHDSGRARKIPKSQILNGLNHPGGMESPDPAAREPERPAPDRGGGAGSRYARPSPPFTLPTETVSAERTPMSSIEERVKKIVVEQLGVKEEEVSANASFVDDLGADSLDTVELVMALEEEFECEIPDEEAEKITSVQQAIDYIKAHVKA